LHIRQVLRETLNERKTLRADLIQLQILMESEVLQAKPPITGLGGDVSTIGNASNAIRYDVRTVAIVLRPYTRG
jgi:hypothetical protein